MIEWKATLHSMNTKLGNSTESQRRHVNSLAFGTHRCPTEVHLEYLVTGSYLARFEAYIPAFKSTCIWRSDAIDGIDEKDWQCLLQSSLHTIRHH